jgi:hypothetical protein
MINIGKCFAKKITKHVQRIKRQPPKMLREGEEFIFKASRQMMRKLISLFVYIFRKQMQNNFILRTAIFV